VVGAFLALNRIEILLRAKSAKFEGFLHEAPPIWKLKGGKNLPAIKHRNMKKVK
jgi:hypothetical protein